MIIWIIIPYNIEKSNENDVNNKEKLEVKNSNNDDMENKTSITIKRKNSKKSNDAGLNFIEKQRNNVFYNIYISNFYNRLREIDNCSDIDAQSWPYELL